MIESKKSPTKDSEEDKHYVYHNMTYYYNENGYKTYHFPVENEILLIHSHDIKNSWKKNNSFVRDRGLAGKDFMIDGQEVEFEARLFHSHLDRILPDLRDFQVVSEMFILCENWEDFNKYLDCDEQIGHVHIARMLR